MFSSLLEHLVHNRIFQFHLIHFLPKPCLKLTIFLGALVSFNEEQYLEAEIWVLGMFMCSSSWGCHCSQALSVDKTENKCMCTPTHIHIFISLSLYITKHECIQTIPILNQYQRAHSSFSFPSYLYLSSLTVRNLAPISFPFSLSLSTTHTREWMCVCVYIYTASHLTPLSCPSHPHSYAVFTQATITTQFELVKLNFGELEWKKRREEGNGSKEGETRERRKEGSKKGRKGRKEEREAGRKKREESWPLQWQEAYTAFPTPAMIVPPTLSPLGFLFHTLSLGEIIPSHGFHLSDGHTKVSISTLYSFPEPLTCIFICLLE